MAGLAAPSPGVSLIPSSQPGPLHPTLRMAAKSAGKMTSRLAYHAHVRCLLQPDCWRQDSLRHKKLGILSYRGEIL